MTYQPKHFEFDRLDQWKEDLLRKEMQADAEAYLVRQAGRGPAKNGPSLQPGSLGWDIKAALEEHGPMTLAEIGRRVGRTRNRIATTVYRRRDKEFRVIGQWANPRGGRSENIWGLIE